MGNNQSTSSDNGRRTGLRSNSNVLYRENRELGRAINPRHHPRPLTASSTSIGVYSVDFSANRGSPTAARPRLPQKNKVNINTANAKTKENQLYSQKSTSKHQAPAHRSSTVALSISKNIASTENDEDKLDVLIGHKIKPIKNTRPLSTQPMRPVFVGRPRSRTQSSEQGVVTVFSGTQKRSPLDPDLEALNAIPKLRPLVLANTGSRLTGLFQSGTRYVEPSAEQLNLDETELTGFCFSYRDCLSDRVQRVCDKQHSIVSSAKQLSTRASSSNVTLIHISQLAKRDREGISVLKSLQRQAEKSYELMQDILHDLERLESLLPLDERFFGCNGATAQKEYPNICKMLSQRRRHTFQSVPSISGYSIRRARTSVQKGAIPSFMSSRSSSIDSSKLSQTQLRSLSHRPSPLSPVRVHTKYVPDALSLRRKPSKSSIASNDQDRPSRQSTPDLFTARPPAYAHNTGYPTSSFTESASVVMSPVVAGGIVSPVSDLDRNDSHQNNRSSQKHPLYIGSSSRRPNSVVSLFLDSVCYTRPETPNGDDTQLWSPQSAHSSGERCTFAPSDTAKTPSSHMVASSELNSIKDIIDKSAIPTPSNMNGISVVSISDHYTNTTPQNNEPTEFGLTYYGRSLEGAVKRASTQRKVMDNVYNQEVSKGDSSDKETKEPNTIGRCFSDPLYTGQTKVTDFMPAKTDINESARARQSHEQPHDLSFITTSNTQQVSAHTGLSHHNASIPSSPSISSLLSPSPIIIPATHAEISPLSVLTVTETSHTNSKTNSSTQVHSEAARMLKQVIKEDCIRPDTGLMLHETVPVSDETLSRTEGSSMISKFKQRVKPEYTSLSTTRPRSSSVTHYVSSPVPSDTTSFVDGSNQKSPRTQSESQMHQVDISAIPNTVYSGNDNKMIAKPERLSVWSSSSGKTLLDGPYSFRIPSCDSTASASKSMVSIPYSAALPPTLTAITASAAVISSRPSSRDRDVSCNNRTENSPLRTPHTRQAELGLNIRSDLEKRVRSFSVAESDTNSVSGDRPHSSMGLYGGIGSALSVRSSRASSVHILRHNSPRSASLRIGRTDKFQRHRLSLIGTNPQYTTLSGRATPDSVHSSSDNFIDSSSNGSPKNDSLETKSNHTTVRNFSLPPKYVTRPLPADTKNPKNYEPVPLQEEC